MDFKCDLSEMEFECLMAEIDERMISEDVRIPARQIRGWMLFCEKQQLHGISFTHPLSTRVMEWFKAKYGCRLNIDSTLGHSVEVIRGDLLRTRVCVFFGGLQVVCHAGLFGRLPGGIAVNRPALVNVLDQVQDMTRPLAKNLSDDDLRKLLRGYIPAVVHCSRIGDAGTQTFVPEARADLQEAVEHMCRHNPQFGLSKWASLQAAEKFLKAYILQQGRQPERKHILEDLATTAESLGLRPITRSTLKMAQCSPSARYEASSVSRAEAIEGYRASVSICAEIALQLEGRSAWSTQVIQEGKVAVEGVMAPLATILISRVTVRSPFDGR